MRTQIRDLLSPMERKLWSSQSGTRALLRALKEEDSLLRDDIVSMSSPQSVADRERVAMWGRLQIVRELIAQLEEFENE